MNKRKLIILTAGLFTLCTALFARGDTYIYNYWDEIEKSPDAYRVSHVFYANDLNLDTPLKNPTSLFAFENKIYLCDTDNNRIIEFEYTENKTLLPLKVIDHVNPSPLLEDTSFKGPQDIYVCQDGTMLIADTDNGRVIKTDKDLNVIDVLTEPDDPTYEKDKAFLPTRVIVDPKGRVYVLSKNVNKGFIKYEYDGEFDGYYGATKVMVNAADRIWKKLATEAQKARMVLFVPTEYSNCYMDNEGFIYAVTKSFEEGDLHSGKAKPLRRLNALGNDILINNGYEPPIGDLEWSNAAGIKGSSKFVDVTVLDNEVYFALDETRGRIFAYNNQGYLLFAFGGRGNIDGFFRKPISLEHIGKDIFVTDATNATITVFTPTDYGNLIYKATEQFAVGKYDDSAETWSKVLALNGNYDLAYIGLGKAYLRQKKYKEAMDYFKLKRDRRDYSLAFKYYRKEWVEANFAWIAALIIAIIVIPLIVRWVKRIKWEISTL
ncbi:MAG: hypothetical protein J5687_08450 [Treponema sp.]|nr:hypothetical protein [Treponema sp.]